MQHTTKDPIWVDEAGMKIPVKRIRKIELLKEKSAGKLLKEASKVSQSLYDLKELVREVCDEIYEAHMDDTGIDEKERGKGNFTWFNFDRSIKIIVKINEQVSFDDLTIKSAKLKLDSFLDRSIEGRIEFAKELVTNAFETRRGNLDAKRVLSLLKYRDRVPDEDFQDACKLIESAVRRDSSKTYFTIWLKEEETGEYQQIKLDFASL